MYLLQPHHYAAFDPPKPHQDGPATRSEREAVRDAFVKLHEMVWPLIRKEKWDLHPHWREENLVSMSHFVPRIVERISAMWLSYGKSKEQIEYLKKLGGTDHRNRDLEENYDAFYHHTRIQFFVNASAFQCWLLLATHSSVVDRSFFLDNKLKSQSERDSFYQLVKPLCDKGFCYRLVDVTVDPEKTNELRLTAELSEKELIRFVTQDKLGYYSGISKEYPPDDLALDESRIRDEMFANLKLLYPLYEFMAWRPGRG